MDDSMQIPPSIRCDVECKGGVEGIAKIAPGQEQLEAKSVIFKALSSQIRLRILALIAIQPMCVCMIKHYVRSADSKLSYHLNILKSAALITSEQEGNFLIYSATLLCKKMVAFTFELTSPGVGQK